MMISEVIKRPVVTEKAVSAQAHGCYVFEVDARATKPLIRQAVETFFHVKVVNIRTNIVPSKTRRVLRGRGGTATAASWKKATIQVADGQTIEMIEGV